MYQRRINRRRAPEASRKALTDLYNQSQEVNGHYVKLLCNNLLDMQAALSVAANEEVLEELTEAFELASEASTILMHASNAISRAAGLYRQ